MGQEKVLRVNVILKGEAARRFEEIKKWKGLANNTELITLMLNEWKP